MNQTRFKIFVVTALVSLAGAAFATPQDATLRELANYRKWTKLTSQPIVVTDSLAAG